MFCEINIYINKYITYIHTVSHPPGFFSGGIVFEAVYYGQTSVNFDKATTGWSEHGRL